MAAPSVKLRGAGSAPPRLPVQLLPCRVGHDGPAPVAAFLRVRPGDDGELWAAFRGRRLGGRDLALPHGYRGWLLQEGEHGSGTGTGGEMQERWLQVTGTFDGIREWGADTVPPPGAGLALPMQWVPLAQALHAPVDEASDDDDEGEEPPQAPPPPI